MAFENGKCTVASRQKDMETEQDSETLIYCHLFFLEICDAPLKLYFFAWAFKETAKMGPETKRSESIALTVSFVDEHQTLLLSFCTSIHTSTLEH